MRFAVALLFLALPVLAEDKTEPADPDAPKLREVSTNRLKLAVVRGRLGEPTKIATEKELAEAFPDAETRATLAKGVNFKKEYLLVFAWSGSGGDRIAYELVKGKTGEEVAFKYTPGLTRDLRPHTKIFAVPAKTTFKVVK